MNLGLQGKKAVVVGGSRGIGLQIAKSLLQEGTDVLVLARQAEPPEAFSECVKSNQLEGELHYLPCDCSAQGELDKLLPVIIATLGKLDILILNAGNGQGSREPVPSETDWSKGWSGNFEVSRLSVNALLPVMAKDSVITFISSIAGMEVVGAPTEYSVAKAAINAFSKNLATKLAPDIRVNVVAPGNILFDGGSWHKKSQSEPERVTAMLKDKVPMQRFGTTDEIADAVLFLVSSKASFITGSVLVVDGGQTIKVN